MGRSKGLPFSLLLIEVSMEITEKEAVTRAARGQLVICSSCYDARGKIVMVRYDETKPRGIVRDFCEECIKGMQGCLTCRKR